MKIVLFIGKTNTTPTNCARETQMSNFNQYRSHEELASPSSDEKMDTGSESFQDTPNSIRSSDFEDNPENVLRLQNPEEKDFEDSLKNETEVLDSLMTHLQHTEESVLDKEELSNLKKNTSTRKDVLKSKALEIKLRPRNPEVLRLSNPEENLSNENDSLSDKMSNLNLSEPRPNHLKIGSPKVSSTLTLTTSHPLMGIVSPDDYPDLIPKKIHKLEDEKDLSLSSVEDERADNGFYSPQRNTSKNNLYFSDNFVTADSHILSNSLDLPPDVARVKVERRLLIPNLECSPLFPRISTSSEGNTVQYDRSHSTPKITLTDDSTQEFHSVAEWSDTPAQLRAMPNFDLPIEMSSGIGNHNELESPDVISSSTQEDKSTYQTLLDPYTGSVALKHTSRPHPPPAPVQRRKIVVPPEDCCSVDSTTSSLQSDEEDVEGREEPGPAPRDEDSDDDTQQSKSTNTVSYTSEPIPEYSLCEELSNERAWMSVHSRTCDVKVIEPYKRVVSHGGYSGSGTGAALIVFSACHLPDNGRHDYTYVMDNLFLYVMWSLERLVTDEYVVVYLHGSAGRRRLPAFHWLHECYKLIDRRLRKSLKHLYLVHPTFWLKTFVLITKPFVSSKFIKKLTYVNSLDELMEKVPVDPNAIPEIVKQYDANRKR